MLTLQGIGEGGQPAAGPEPAAPAYDFVGQALGNWKLVRLIGEGAFGVVYEASNTIITGRRAAVKVLHPHMSMHLEMKQRFLNEANAASRAEHENIVQIFDGGITDQGICYSVMELLKGVTLTDLQKNGRMEIMRTINIALQLASALQAAHDIGVVHRDLKPDNVFITQRVNNPEFVKILDFGVAKLRSELDETPHTRMGMLIGTPGYMSPEQWMTLADLDGRADIYALGVMLFECLTGNLPFSGTTPFEWQQAHLQQPVPLMDMVENVAPELSRLVTRMMAKKREERPQTMLEVARGLQVVRASLTARRSGIFEPAPPPPPPSGPAPGLPWQQTGISSGGAVVGPTPAGRGTPPQGVAQPSSGTPIPGMGRSTPPQGVAQPSSGTPIPGMGRTTPPQGIARPSAGTDAQAARSTRPPTGPQAVNVPGRSATGPQAVIGTSPPAFGGGLAGFAPRNLIPRVGAGVDLCAMPLGPTQGFIVSRIDGQTTLGEICLLAPFPEDETVSILRGLLARGVIEIPGLPVGAGANSTAAAPRPGTPIPSPANGTGRSPAPNTTGNADAGAVDLEPAFCRRIDDALAAVGRRDDRALFGVATTASTREIRHAYFRLAKEYHPDRFYGKRLGPYRERLETLFAALNEAYGRLSRNDSGAVR